MRLSPSVSTVPVQPAALETALLDRARAVEVGGTVLPFIQPDDLIVATILAGRPKDLEDAHNLWRAQGPALDAGRIRETLRLLEEALGQSDLVSGFEGIMSRGGGP